MTSVGIETSLLVSAAPLPVIDESRARPFWLRADVIVCTVSLIVLCAWLLIFPFTGEGDSILHYLNAREAYMNPGDSLHPWARPGYKLFLAWFAMHGITAARLFMAFVATAVVWQTIRLAEDLELPRAYLAGAMVLWQPMAFAVAADTMTEFPMALGLILAVRCWIKDWKIASCIIVGFLPSVRPEGFFFGLLWGLMAMHELFGRGNRRAVAMLPALTVGMLVWIGACIYWTNDWLHVVHIWNWPPKTYDTYSRGSLLHHVIWWPIYCGVPLTGLFLAGIRPSWRKEMWLPWAAWFVVFGVHSVLYWGGWFCSCGLMRIMSCIAPFTAVICLQGWNRAAEFLRDRWAWNALRIQRAAISLAVAATGWTLGQYLLTRPHYDCFQILRCTSYIRDHHLLAGMTPFFAGNQIAAADLNLAPHRPHVMETPCDPQKIHQSLAELPIGAIGVWDNRQAPIWHGHSIEDLTHNGFTVLYETHQTVLSRTMRYVVLRKDGVFPARQ